MTFESPGRWGTRKHHCPIHPHIYTNGHICLSIIYDDWSPALGVEAVCHSMVSMLSSAKEKNPPADNEMHVDSVFHHAHTLSIFLLLLLLALLSSSSLS